MKSAAVSPFSEVMSETDTAGLPGAAAHEIAAIARRARAAGGPVMRAVTALGSGIEGRLKRLPDPARKALDDATAAALTGAYRAAAGIGSSRAIPRVQPRTHRLAAALSGAAGGFGGLPSALVELPATVALMFGAMQKIATRHGFDPASEEVRIACVETFGSGGPQESDDGVNTSFVGARLGVNGATIQAVIARVTPIFATMLGRQLATKAVPVLGAAAGAGVNYAFMGYYQEMADVRFALMRLARDHGEDAVDQAFQAELNRLRLDGRR